MMNDVSKSIDGTTCPACGYILQPGLAECPNCGTIIPQNMSDETVAVPIEPAKRTVRKSKPKNIDVNSLESYRGTLKEAQQKEEAGDLAGALAVYRRALAFMEADHKADPSLELAMQTLGTLIQRTEQLLALQTAPTDLADTSEVEPAPQVIQSVELPIEEEGASVSPPPEVSETLSPLSPLPRDNAPTGRPDRASQATIPPWIREPDSLTSSPPPKRSRRTKTVVSVVGGVILLILLWVVVGLGVNGKLTGISIFNTRTPTPIPTPTPTPTPVWDFELTDSFESNQYGWTRKTDATSECGTESLNILNGMMIWLINDSQECYWYEFPSVPSATDFDVSVDIQRITGSEDSDYGLMLRRQSTFDHYYFAISDNYPTYGFFIFQQDAWSILIDWTNSAAIRTGEVNHLRVTGQGSHFTFYINNQKVATYDDSKLSKGQFGLAGEPRGATTPLKLNIDNFELHGNR